ncbi:MAG: cytochrome c family protein [Alphaproteobacteria bacterium]|nr:MAG: cytochrome c family protein [Alphaproteobacteria bacterium]
MNTFEFNKIAGAVLAGILLLMVIGEVAHFAVEPTHLDKPAYAIDTSSVASTEVASDDKKKPQDPPIGVLMASADPAKGEKIFKKCHACHNAEEGAGAKIGPDLYGILDRPKGSAEGFSYSSGMKEKGGNWTYEDLYHFLKKPSAFIDGTKMSFAGLKKPEDRADIIAFLRTLGKSDVPLPPAQ